MQPLPEPRIGILVVAYNAESTLAALLDRIPHEFRPRVTEVLVCDDHSDDDTYLVGLDYQETSDLPITVIRHPVNLGYGGNQKAGYRMAVERGLDIIVLLHGDGQYAPECIETLVKPLARGEADAVFGSRMLVRGDALKGGMPLYKYVGNRVLTTFQNAVLRTHLSEFHSGYRAYSVKALSELDLEQNSNGFDFDTQIILQLLEHGHRIAEVPIPTYYGDEICYVNGMKYASDVARHVVRYRRAKLPLGQSSLDIAEPEYSLKDGEDTSHGVLLAWAGAMAPSKVLDLGCSGGRLSERLRAQGHVVVGVDIAEVKGAAERVDELVIADLANGIPAAAGRDFDIVIAADVIEHLSEPRALLSEIRTLVRPRGVLLVSVPNFAHWYPRLRIAVGRFDYDRRGILDRGHLRFFTRRSLRRMTEESGWRVDRVAYVGVPLEILAPRRPRWSVALGIVERWLLRVWPNLFAYQLLVRLIPDPPVSAEHEITLVTSADMR
jgi:glycosyltransferase involved in cell wall biosynthesis